eukprot:6197218-Pleurochrysis_carterae.AAC.1
MSQPGKDMCNVRTNTDGYWSVSYDRTGITAEASVPSALERSLHSIKTKIASAELPDGDGCLKWILPRWSSEIMTKQ